MVVYTNKFGDVVKVGQGRLLLNDKLLVSTESNEIYYRSIIWENLLKTPMQEHGLGFVASHLTSYLEDIKQGV